MSWCIAWNMFLIIGGCVLMCVVAVAVLLAVAFATIYIYHLIGVYDPVKWTLCTLAIVWLVLVLGEFLYNVYQLAAGPCAR